MVSKRWTWPVALAVLFAGLTNAHAHVHYCFDGQEPAASVRLVDSADQAPCHDANDCDYVDVDVPSETFAATCAHDLPAITSHISAGSFEALPAGALAHATGLPPTPSPRYLHPQPRGPPR